MRRILLAAAFILGLICIGAVHAKSRVDRLIIVVHDYAMILDATVDRDSLSLNDRIRLDRAKRELDRLYREVR